MSRRRAAGTPVSMALLDPAPPSAFAARPVIVHSAPLDQSSFIRSRIDQLANRLYPESEIGPVRIEIARLKIQLSELAAAQVSP